MHHSAYSSHRDSYPSYLQWLLRILAPCSIIHREQRRVRSIASLVHHPSHPRPKCSARPYGILLIYMKNVHPPILRERRPTRKRGVQTNVPAALRSLGDRVRQARARRGMTRKQLARDSGVSERYLAQIESGNGNISVLVLRRLAKALGMSVEVLLVEDREPPVELTHTVEFLRRLSLDDLKLARHMLLQQFGGLDPAARHRRIALIGLRGAGKSTLGAALAERLEMPFLELDRLIEQESGLTLSLIFEFHGQSGFRRLERQCLEEAIQRHPCFVMATGGSLVSEAGTFERLLSSCFTVWLKTSPEEHMERVIAQGDMRPISEHSDAMSDLKRILSERDALYAKADIQVDTAGRTVEESLEILIRALRDTPVRESLTPTIVSR
ncbi:MAG: helix-turn-helix transcriptional regulator [Candidatus Acidiferrales bacterium]